MPTDKLCLACFSAEFPGVRSMTVTLGRECSRCHTPTQPGATLIKVERPEPETFRQLPDGK